MFSGARPSSGAASSACSNALDFCRQATCFGRAAPEDVRAPLNRYVARPGQVACPTPFNFGFRDEDSRGRTVVCGVGITHISRTWSSTSHGRGLIASRSDEPTVAVGFIPRFGTSDALRRGATPDSGAVFSIVAPRRRISRRIEPWLESHGYHRQVAPRLRKCAA